MGVKINARKRMNRTGLALTKETWANGFSKKKKNREILGTSGTPFIAAVLLLVTWSSTEKQTYTFLGIRSKFDNTGSLELCGDIVDQIRVRCTFSYFRQ